MGHVVTQFHVLARDADGAHRVLTVNGARDQHDARNRVSGFAVVDVGDDHQRLSERARQLNAAHGIVPTGCSSC